MKHQNKAFKCLFDCGGGGDLTKRQRLHLLTASQRECKEITKSRLFTLDPALSCDFHFTVPVIAAVWQMLFVSFILSQKQGGSTLYSPCPRRLDLAQNTHLCFLGLHECIWPSLLVQNNRLLLGRIIAVSIKPVWGRDERSGTCVHLTCELLIPAPPLASLGMEVGNVSSHNGRIPQTCCLGRRSEEGRQEQNC